MNEQLTAAQMQTQNDVIRKAITSAIETMKVRTWAVEQASEIAVAAAVSCGFDIDRTKELSQFFYDFVSNGIEKSTQE